MNWSPPLRRRVRAFGLATMVVAVANAMVAPAHATFVVDGVVLGLPANTSSELTPRNGGPSNLGSFDIVLNPGATLAGNAAALAAFNRAVATWESRIADPITVNIDADMASLGMGILGSASTMLIVDTYSAIRGQMVLDAADETDDVIVASLPTSAQFSATLPNGFTLGTNMLATTANAKALGYTFGAGADATITFSTNYSFDYDKSDGITAGQTDFEGVAAHEIGHALGFVSIVDGIDTNSLGTTTNVRPLPFDLFRFEDGSANDPGTAVNFTTFVRDLRPGSTAIFDQTTGNSGQWGDPEVLMSTGVNGGDGRQASHWKDFLSLGIMDPTASPGELLAFRENDFRMLDLIGYEISAVPELRALLTLPLAGTLVIGGHWLAASKRGVRPRIGFLRRVVRYGVRHT